MSAMIAYCGLICHTCPIYLATRVENKEEKLRAREEISRFCKEFYGMEYEPEDINDCDGCKTEGGRLFTACKHCSIRNCAKLKGLLSCVYCSEYVCEKLEEFFTKEPDAKKRLDEIKINIDEPTREKQ